jgi:hypothetical protein
MKTVPRIFLLALVSSSLGLFFDQAQARPIQGQIDFNGVVTFNTVSLATATQVTQWNSSFVIPGSQTGDFSSIPDFTNVTMASSWTFNSGAPGAGGVGGSQSALWSVGGFTFNLTSSLVVSQSSTFLDVSGVGTLTSTDSNLDPTAGTWSFTSSRADGQTSTTFGFQSNTIVPEPGTLALFGIGGACLAARVLAGRKSKAE